MDETDNVVYAIVEDDDSGMIGGKYFILQHFTGKVAVNSLYFFSGSQAITNFYLWKIECFFKKLRAGSLGGSLVFICIINEGTVFCNIKRETFFCNIYIK